MTGPKPALDNPGLDIGHSECVAGSAETIRSGWRAKYPQSARSILWCAAIAAAALAADASTKAWAAARLAGGRDITTAGDAVRLQLVINHGASFGLGSGYEPLIAAVTVIGVILLGRWALRAENATERLGAALAAAGAIGNLIDRVVRAPGIFHGGVIDWLHLSFYSPTFNLADVWLRAGLLIAVIGWLRRRGSVVSRASESGTEAAQDG
jgi:signal peptidase II